MARTCTVCRHPDREAIDAALANNEAYRSIAAHFAASPAAVLRHKRDHLPVTLARAHAAAEVAHADSLLEQMRNIQARTLTILDSAENAGALNVALMAIGQARNNVELLAKLQGQLQQEGVVNITLAPEWLSLQAVIVAALGSYPDARQSVLEAIDAFRRG